MPITAPLVAELRKLRRTRALWLALGAPLAVVLLYFLMIVSGGIKLEEIGWARSAQGIVTLWGMLMAPLYIALETAFINAIDHEARGWKHLFALPVPRWTIHAAKLIVAVAMVAMSAVVLVAGLAGTIALLTAAGVGAPDDPIPWGLMVAGAAYSYGGSIGIIAIHHGISLRLRGFEWPLGLGIAGVVFAAQMGRSEYWFLLPWCYPFVAAASSDPTWRLGAIGLSVGIGVVAALVTAWDTTRRDIV